MRSFCIVFHCPLALIVFEIVQLAVVVVQESWGSDGCLALGMATARYDRVEGFSGGGGEGHNALDCLLQGIHC